MTMFFKKILAKKKPNKAFLVTKLYAFEVFRKILQLYKFQGADFKYDNSFFKF